MAPQPNEKLWRGLGRIGVAHDGLNPEANSAMGSKGCTSSTTASASWLRKPWGFHVAHESKHGIESACHG